MKRTTDTGLRILLLKKVSRAEHVHDYVQLQFDDGTILNIFNRYSLTPAERDDIARLVGTTVSAAELIERSERLRFSDGTLLRIGMMDSDYNGPEAIEVIDHDGRRVVWTE